MKHLYITYFNLGIRNWASRLSINMSYTYTIDHLKAAFDAGKRFNMFEDWIEWSNQEWKKALVTDPYALADKIIEIGGVEDKDKSTSRICINLKNVGEDIFYGFLTKEFFEQHGYGRGDLIEYRSPKYHRIVIHFDSIYGYAEIFPYDGLISRNQRNRDVKINSVIK